MMGKIKIMFPTTNQNWINHPPSFTSMVVLVKESQHRSSMSCPWQQLPLCPPGQLRISEESTRWTRMLSVYTVWKKKYHMIYIYIYIYNVYIHTYIYIYQYIQISITLYNHILSHTHLIRVFMSLQLLHPYGFRGDFWCAHVAKLWLGCHKNLLILLGNHNFTGNHNDLPSLMA